jgi:hypothetical protein
MPAENAMKVAGRASAKPSMNGAKRSAIAALNACRSRSSVVLPLVEPEDDHGFSLSKRRGERIFDAAPDCDENITGSNC